MRQLAQTRQLSSESSHPATEWNPGLLAFCETMSDKRPSKPDMKSSAPQSDPTQAEAQLPPNNPLLDHARKFLASEMVKSASRDKKESFLRAKGIANSDIEQLLAETEQEGGNTKHHIANVSSHNTNTIPPTPEKSITATTSSTDRGSSSTGQLSSSTNFSHTMSTSPAMPPIITYPEFITSSHRPPPLVTIDRVINTAYVSATVGTLAWAVSKTLIRPMIDTQVEARQSLAAFTLDKVTKLVHRLEGAVSVIPPDYNTIVGSNVSVFKSNNQRHAHTALQKDRRHTTSGDGEEEEENDDDTSHDGESNPDDEGDAHSTARHHHGSSQYSLDSQSYVSDPMELFHRDVGIQTTGSLPASPQPRMSYTLSPPAGISRAHSPLPTSSNALVTFQHAGVGARAASAPVMAHKEDNISGRQADRLSALSASLRTLCDGLDPDRSDHENPAQSSQALEALVDLMREDLNQLMQPGPDTVGSVWGNGAWGLRGKTMQPDDEIKRTRDKIRKLKGQLLSSKTFPIVGAGTGTLGR